MLSKPCVTGKITATVNASVGTFQVSSLIYLSTRHEARICLEAALSNLNCWQIEGFLVLQALDESITAFLRFLFFMKYIV